MLSINTNLSSLIAQSSMKTSSDLLNQAVERMTTGYKINHASDNAANYSISTNLTTQINSYMVAEDNVLQGLDMVNTASENLSLIDDKLNRLRALAVQSTNGTYGGQSLNAINNEANALVDEIERLYNTAKYNEKQLFYNPEVKNKSYSDAQLANLPSLTKTLEAGTLEANKTYTISSAEELAKLATIVNAGIDTTDMTFVLANDINLAQWCKDHESIGGWVPIGSHTNRFKGSFDGNGFAVKDVYINRPTKTVQGLFGATLNSEIRNLTIKGGSITGSSYVGGLTGINSTGSIIANCHAFIDIIGINGECVGGLLGYHFADSVITNSDFKGSVSAAIKQTGGLVGYSQRAFIDNSYAVGNVEGLSWVGGLVGYVEESDIKFSFSECDIVATGIAVGGLIGIAKLSNIYNCYATGNVVTEKNINDVWAGGFIGRNEESIISNCYSSGDVVGYAMCLGGFAGQNINGQISNCYSLGNVSGETKYVAGFVGYAGSGTITSCYSNGEVSSIASSTVDGFSGTTSGINDCATSAKILSIRVDNLTYEEIKKKYTNEYMGFTFANNWTEVNDVNILSWQKEASCSKNIKLQVGINGNESSRINLDTGFSILGISDLRNIGLKSKDYLAKVDLLLDIVSQKQTEYGAMQNRLYSALESIEVNINNLTSSRSTIRDADIAEVSSDYIRQQILQQASATLMATANQSPAIALQLI